MQGEDFLRKCLRKAKFEADLLQDTIDACEINDLTALILGSGALTAAEASEKLFLMQDEASSVVAVCRKECLRAGVSYGDGVTLDPADAADEEPEPQPGAHVICSFGLSCPGKVAAVRGPSCRHQAF